MIELSKTRRMPIDTDKFISDIKKSMHFSFFGIFSTLSRQIRRKDNCFVLETTFFIVSLYITILVDVNLHHLKYQH